MKKYVICILLLVVIAVAGVSAGTSMGFEYSNGTMGSFSFFQAGFFLPRIRDTLTVGISARICSSLTWATFINMDTGAAVSFHPVLAAGVFSFRGNSPMIHDMLVMYGGSDILLGYTFTPYDSLIYGTANLVGPNLTFGVVGYFGFELFTGPAISFFIDAGGGFKSISGDEENQYVIAVSWLGSGFSYRMGLRYYL